MKKTFIVACCLATILLLPRSSFATESAESLLGKTFPRVNSAFSSFSVALENTQSDTSKSPAESISENNTGESTTNLANGLIIRTRYSKKSESRNDIQIKQIIKVDNTSGQDYAGDIIFDQTLDARGSVTWDGKEYNLETPLETKAYTKHVIIDPTSHDADKQFGDLPIEIRRKIPTITKDELHGASVSFTATGGKTATYDFSDLANQDHTLILEKRDGFVHVILTLKHIEVKANSSIILDPIYSLATLSYNVRIDGAVTGDHIWRGYIADFDGDGKEDLVVNTIVPGNNGRSFAGAMYVIFGKTLATLPQGSVLDMNNTAQFDIRIDGAATNDSIIFAQGGASKHVDIDGDGKDDLIVMSLNDAGASWIITGAMLSAYTGHGNIVDLANPTSYFLKISGANSGDRTTVRSVGDVNGNGRQDLVAAGFGADNNSRNNSGAAYLIYDSVISQYSGTGNVLNLSDMSKVNVRFDGPDADDGIYLGTMADVVGDSGVDMIVSQGQFDSGGILVDSSIFRSLTGTGNIIDLANPAKFTVKLMASSGSNFLPFLVARPGQDFDRDGKTDIIFTGFPSSPEYFYIIAGSKLKTITGTGNLINATDPANYLVKVFTSLSGTSAFTDQIFGDDYTGDGYSDLIFDTYRANNGFNDSGSAYVVSSTKLSQLSGTGNNLDISDPNTYAARFDGPFVGAEMGTTEGFLGDVNGDGITDMLTSAYGAGTNGKTNNGSVYLIYNFPHTLTAGAVPSVTRNTSAIVTGTATTTGFSTLSAVQYSLDSNNPISTWNTCSGTATYTCSLTNIADGNHTIYIRAVDDSGTYTARNSYLSRSFTIDSTVPQTSWTTSSGKTIGFGLDGASDIFTTDPFPEFTFTRANDSTSGIGKYQIVIYSYTDGEKVLIDSIQPESTSSDNLKRDNDDLSIHYDNNQYKIAVKGHGDKYKLPQGAYKWKVRAIDRAGNSVSTPWNILRINYHSTNFNNGTYLPLILYGIGSAGKVAISSYWPFNTSKTYGVSSKPTLYGVTYAGSEVRVAVQDKNAKTVYEGKTYANASSQFGFNVKPVLKVGTYIVRVSAVAPNGDVADIPDFKIKVGR